ncbi:MAG: hypothetical protein KatS3mg026_0229 [Bacteroidia bacterium]|nr:MAG: hypothetical protein KatS3mg026_0229 [Bacteroidia bacterium]
MEKWAGVDLAASPAKPSAVAVGEGWEDLTVFTVFSDEALLKAIEAVKAVWIDAPLTAAEGPFRSCDKRLHGYGLTPLPLSWPAMRALHQRARRLLDRGRGQAFHETFPWALYAWLGEKAGFRPRRKDLALLAAWAEKQGLQARPTSVHEWDAVACWAIGWLAHQGWALVLSAEDGTLWLPPLTSKGNTA